MSTYRKAGVDIQAGEQAVRRIKDTVRSTYTKNVLTDLGSFGGCYAFPKDQYMQPVLVSSTDGVGTKLLVAGMMDRYDTIGQCLVNHCVNDILTTGAEPLFFLDYIGIGKMDSRKVEDIVKGLSQACRENQCALIGGEMAEMPGIYRPDDFDLAGTIVGVAEQGRILNDRVCKGDVLIGLPSSGLHTNGYSLARSVLFAQFKVDDYVDELQATVGELLLRVHRSYLNPVRPLLGDTDLHGISHITGGGIVGNTERILTDGMQLKIDWQAWEWLPIFRLIQEVGKVSTAEMRHVFNLGIGLILIVDPKRADAVFERLEQKDANPVYIGHVF